MRPPRPDWLVRTVLLPVGAVFLACCTHDSPSPDVQSRGSALSVAAAGEGSTDFGQSPEARMAGTYALVEAHLGSKGTHKAGQGGVWGSVDLQPGGRYVANLRIQDDDPPAEGGWFVDGDSIRFSGPMESYVGPTDDGGTLTLIAKPVDSYNVIMEETVEAPPTADSPPLSAEEVRLRDEHRRVAREQALVQMTEERERNRTRLVLRKTQ